MEIWLGKVQGLALVFSQLHLSFEARSLNSQDNSFCLSCFGRLAERRSLWICQVRLALNGTRQDTRGKLACLQ